ncbi:protein suppressor of variegation 3-7 [Drosophila gunungcola]|uniref:protein suppressor of variegation 3-7 n=1 Tax=Drosophila gunungcola TaxID=103775 RepID=UPI0022E1027A|nr:protein suppressor of variegation 3-7 [Drosophila gunungcola]
MWNNSKVCEKNNTKSEEDEEEEPSYVKEPEATSSLLIKRNNMSLRRNQLLVSKPIPQNRQELLQNIGRDREILGAYFQRLASQSAPKTPAPAPAPAPPAPQRNSYDLFFESACVSVKGLPPKLAAEAKSRISQIITEFEIRAISEMEAQQERQMQKQPYRSGDASGILYEFRPCP